MYRADMRSRRKMALKKMTIWFNRNIRYGKHIKGLLVNTYILFALISDIVKYLSHYTRFHW